MIFSILPAKPAHQKTRKIIFFPTLLSLRSYHQNPIPTYQTTQLNQKIAVHEKKKLASVNPKQPVLNYQKREFEWHYHKFLNSLPHQPSPLTKSATIS